MWTHSLFLKNVTKDNVLLCIPVEIVGSPILPLWIYSLPPPCLTHSQCASCQDFCPLDFHFHHWKHMWTWICVYIYVELTFPLQCSISGALAIPINIKLADYFYLLPGMAKPQLNLTIPHCCTLRLFLKLFAMTVVLQQTSLDLSPCAHVQAFLCRRRDGKQNW